MNGSGLVGIVYEVSNNYSKAISLLDSKASVSFKLAKDANAKGTITQNTTLDNKDSYNSKGYLQGYMFDSSYNVIQGDIITTSGLDSSQMVYQLAKLKKWLMIKISH